MVRLEVDFKIIIRHRRTFQFLVVRLEDALYFLSTLISVISIPCGAIRSLLNEERPMTYNLFQFLVVRLEGAL